MTDSSPLSSPRRRRTAAAAGHTGDEAGARACLGDADPGVRATALGALGRLGVLAADDLAAALSDSDPALRRRACELAVPLVAVDLIVMLGDEDPLVAETAAWALGEREEGSAVGALAAMATGHADALCREAAVAALGAIGDPAGLPAILTATTDKPAVRRRAVLALAPFEGPEVDAALEHALQDRDWQVRQAAEDLTVSPSEAEPPRRA
ncbi:MAG TPA: HEAT repeat domain-containing protein [Acidimicrobiales bacterium]|nr:HEAT repeat domain-containing protein [Acidimicrobiales bacterium]